jgi:hypothetical protein
MVMAKSQWERDQMGELRPPREMAESPTRVRMDHWAPGSYVLVTKDGPWVYAFSAGLPIQAVLRTAHEQVTQEWLPYDGPIHPEEPAESPVIPEVLWISPPTRELSAKQVSLAQLAALLRKAGYDVYRDGSELLLVGGERT